MKLTKILLALLILTLPLIHGRVFQTLWFDVWLVVSGNFEFTKALYFNAFSCTIFLIFFIEYILIWWNKVLLTLREKYVLISAFVILWLSTYFSLSPFISLIGDLEKGHTFFLVSNLIGLYVIMRQVIDSHKDFLVKIFILSWVLSCMLAIKELYYPSFDYGSLWSRALGSFGHPNYLSGFLLLLLPFICSPSTFSKGRIQVGIKIWVTLLFLTTIILCKSLIAIFLAGLYLLHISDIWKKYITKTYFTILIAIISLLSLGFISVYFPEKLHSLISRWYLWETTLKIIFSDLKWLLFGAGLETLPYYFNSFKVPEIYIFENFGYSADRPHNFFLNIFYHFWLFWIWIFVYILFLLQRKYLAVKRRGDGFTSSERIWFSCLTLFLLYWVFHYFSISSYLILIFAASLFWQSGYKTLISGTLLFIIITLISIFWSLLSIKLYAAEIYYSAWEPEKSLEIFSHPKYLLKFWETESAANREGIISVKNYKTRLILTQDKQSWCDSLLAKYPSAENYFYCWDLLDLLWDVTVSKNYYNKWLSRLPDLWNENSPYWNNYFVKHTITGNRFFSEKFWDINNILEKVGK